MAWKVPAQGRVLVSVLAKLPASVPRPAPGAAPRERHQQDAAGIGAVGDKMHDAMCKRRRLARAGAGDDEEGGIRNLIDAVQDGAALVGIELVEIARGHPANSFAWR